jgi:hypothetical protein
MIAIDSIQKPCKISLFFIWIRYLWDQYSDQRRILVVIILIFMYGLDIKKDWSNYFSIKKYGLHSKKDWSNYFRIKKTY